MAPVKMIVTSVQGIQGMVKVQIIVGSVLRTTDLDRTFVPLVKILVFKKANLFSIRMSNTWRL